MSESQRWLAGKAWLGGDELASDVLIEATNGVITSITPESGDDAAPLPGVVIPGLVSAHSHAFHRMLRGRTHAAGGDFWAWRAPMYELAGQLTPDSYLRLATSLFTEMLLSGITTVGEFHYIHHQPDGTPYPDANAMGRALIEAADTVGIRLTLLDTAYLSSSVYGDPPLQEQRRFADASIETWADRIAGLEGSEKARIGVAAHSVRALSPTQLETVVEVGQAIDGPVHVHASEQPSENEECLRAHGVTPVGLLADTGFLGPQTTVVHGTHVTEADIELLASSGSGVCFCPTTEADLGDGIGPATEYAAAGVPLTLGSDSNTVTDILEEASRLELHDRLRLGRRGLHSPAALLEAATWNGARSLGWEAGRIAPGYFADLVSLDTQSLELAGTPADLASITMSATRASVQMVIVGGNEVDLPFPSYEEHQ